MNSYRPETPTERWLRQQPEPVDLRELMLFGRRDTPPTAGRPTGRRCPDPDGWPRGYDEESWP